MNSKLLMGLGLVATLVSAPATFAQVPAAGGAGAIPGMPAAPAAPAAPANLWSFLCPTADQKAACKTCFCNSPIGQMVNGAAGPLSAMSGGLVGGCCSKASLADDLKKAADDPNGLAARVKSDEEDAKARRAAVRFLGTVDCNYWPEAIEALKSALRKDRNECVRFEAALALRRGCCCNKEIIDALTNCVLGEQKKDPFPAERSDRVRAVAAEALTRCPLMQTEPRPGDKLVRGDGKPQGPKDYYKTLAETPNDVVVGNARAVLVSLKKVGTHAPAENTQAAADASVPAAPAIVPRNNSVSGIVAGAFSSNAADGGPRQPFFAKLTQTLTGRQERPQPVHQNTTASPRPPVNEPRDPRSAESPNLNLGLAPSQR